MSYASVAPNGQPLELAVGHGHHENTGSGFIV